MSSKINKVSKPNDGKKSSEERLLTRNYKKEDSSSTKRYKENVSDPKKPIKGPKSLIEATYTQSNKSVVNKPLSTPRPVIKSKNTLQTSSVASTAPKLNTLSKFNQRLDIKKKTSTSSSIRKIGTKSDDKTKVFTNVTVNSPTHKKISHAESSIIQSENSRNITTTSEQEVNLISHKRYPTRTLETEEIKILDKNKLTEIKKENPLFKEIPIGEPKAFFVSLDEKFGSSKGNTSQDNHSDSYEDDFESYESDFESYSSSETDAKQCDSIEESSEEDKVDHKIKLEDEKKFDSGNYELGETSKVHDILPERILINNKQIVPDASHVSLTDEGFDENSLGLPSIQTSKTSPKTNAIRKESASKINSSIQRYLDLKQLITLDEVKYSLFEMYPMDYDTFISIYGKSNMNQIQCQTNDDNTDAEIQTDLIPSCNKWTQYPVDYSGFILSPLKQPETKNYKKLTGKIEEYYFKKLNPLEAYISQRFGSGSIDFIMENEIGNQVNSIKNIASLSKFVNRTGNLILQYLSEQKFYDKNMKPNQKKLNILDSILKSRPIEKLLTVDSCKNVFLTLHPPLNKKIDEMDNEDSYLKTYICVWLLQNDLLEPMKILVTSDKVTFCSLNGGISGLVVAGLSNGNICAWDLKESEIWHMDKKINEKEAEQYNKEHSINNDIMILRKCSFHSSMINSKINVWGSVIDIAFVENSKNEITDKISDYDKDPYTMNSIQVITLQEYGILTIWTVINKLGDVDKITNISAFNGCDSYWARISFFKSKVINLHNEMRNDPREKIQQEKISNEYIRQHSEDESDALYKESKLDDRKGIIRAFIEDDQDIFDVELEDVKQKQSTCKDTVEKDKSFEILIICKSIKYSPVANSLLIIFNNSNIINYSLSGMNMKRSIYCCDDEGSYFTGIEICPLKLPYFLVGCGNSIIHLYSFQSEKPIKNFIFNEKDSKLISGDKQSFVSLSGVLKLQTVQTEKWYGKSSLYWLLENPYNFISYHENFGIVLWDLMYSDLSPKTLIYECDNKNTTEVLNIAFLEDVKQGKRNAMVLHTNKDFIKIYELANRANVKLLNGDDSRSFLNSYFESL